MNAENNMEKLKEIRKEELDKLLRSLIDDGSSVETSEDDTLAKKFSNRLKKKHTKMYDFFPNGLDLIKRGFLYGKINTNGRIVMPKEESLRKIPSIFNQDEELYLNKDFLSLYIKFYEEHKEEIAFNFGGMKEYGGIFKIKEASRRPIQIIEDYKRLLKKNVLDSILEFIVPDDSLIKDNITNFYQFLKAVSLLSGNNKIPSTILLSEYIKSSNNSILDTGLAIECFDERDMSFFSQSDPYKRVMYRMIKKGIRYDENLPWRFFFDLRRDEAKKVFTTQEDFFNKNYDVVNGTEMEFSLLYEALHECYEELLIESPRLFIYGLREGCNEENRISSRTLKRKKMTKIEFDRLYRKDKTIFLESYANIMSNMWNSHKKLNNVLKTALRKNQKNLDLGLRVKYVYGKLSSC